MNPKPPRTDTGPTSITVYTRNFGPLTVKPDQVITFSRGLLGFARLHRYVLIVVDREDLTNAIALNSTMFNSAIVVGPAVAGAVYAALGPAWCFAINGLSFIAVIVALSLMRLQPVAIQPSSRSTLSAIRECIQYALSERMTRTLILNMGVISLFGVSMMTLIPAWAVSVLGGDVRTNGLLLSSRGLGALIGALMIAGLSHRGIRGKLWTAGSLVLPITMIAFSLARWLPVSMLRLADDHWHFNLDTKATRMSKGIWLLEATLSDGSQHTVWIQLK